MTTHDPLNGPERYRTYREFCRTASYQQWSRDWQPPRDGERINWVDSDDELKAEDGYMPRLLLNERHGTRLPYHLLDTLDMGTRDCVDIGCGHNPFREVYPGLRGVDPACKDHRDELMLLPHWFRYNRGRWSHAFSCNAIHYCNQDQIHERVAQVRSILRPGGTAVIMINRARIKEQTKEWDPVRLEQELSRTPGLTRMVWIDRPEEAPMDGNIWLWLCA